MGKNQKGRITIWGKILATNNDIAYFSKGKLNDDQFQFQIHRVQF